MLPKFYSAVSAGDSSGPVATFSSLGAVNFSGHTVGGVRSAFTVGGWVRRTQAGVLQMLFKAPAQFQLWLDESGYLTAAVLHDSTVVRSSLPIADAGWHHVAASFQQDPDHEGAGYLSVFLDGMPDSAEVGTSDVHTQSTCTLGAAGESLGIEFASWTIWTRALPNAPFDLPPWGAPPADSPLREGLLAVFDFAGQSITSSNPNVSVVCAKRTMTWPCLTMTGAGFATIAPQTGLAVGNSSAWSLSFWAKVPQQSEGAQFIPFQNGGRGGPGEHPSFTVAINLGQQQSIEVSRVLPPANADTIVTGPCNVVDWTHVALTYDTQSISLYVNGNLVAPPAAFALTDNFDSPVLALGADNVPACYMQDASFWNRALGADELASIADSVPVDADGLQCSFPLITDLFDTVTGANLTFPLSGGGLGADHATTSAVASVYQALASGQDTRDSSGGRTLVAQDYWDLAQQAGITIPDRSERDATPDLAAFYQSDYFNIPEPARSRVIDHFDRAYRLGQALHTRGIKAGRVEATVEDGQNVFYYNTLNGRTEIDRRDLNLSPHDIWLITILMDVLFVMFAFVGVALSPRAVGAAVRGRRLSRLFPAITAAINSAPPGVSGAMMIVGNIIGILSQAGTLASLVWNIITYSWWDLIFVGLSILASLAALVIAPASVGWRLANVAVAVANLAFDLTLKPATAHTAATA